MEVVAHDYELLDYVDKIEVLFTAGRFCALKIEEFYQINLYQLNDFYVEAWFGIESLSFEKILIVKAPVHFFIDSNTGLYNYSVD